MVTVRQPHQEPRQASQAVQTLKGQQHSKSIDTEHGYYTNLQMLRLLLP